MREACLAQVRGYVPARGTAEGTGEGSQVHRGPPRVGAGAGKGLGRMGPSLTRSPQSMVRIHEMG